MARARRKTGDDATVARKRFTREANRYLRQAERATSPAQADRYRELARASAENALATYEKEVPYSKMRKDLQKVALQTGADFQTVNESRRKKIRASLINLDEDKGAVPSSRALNKKRTVDQRRDYEARSLLSGHVGNRIFGALSEIWQPAISRDARGKTHIDRAEMERLIFDFLGVSDWMSAIERFEQEYGEELYAEPTNEIRYDNIVNSAVERLSR